MYRILIVDDDLNNTTLIDFLLTQSGLRATAVHSAAQALEHLSQQAYDLVILDIMMPDMDGLELCVRLRETLSIPIIVISAMGQASDKVRAFQVGADDYISKPFDAEEMLARIWTALRRNNRQTTRNGILTTPDFILDSVNNEVVLRSDGRKLRLTPSETRILHFLGMHPYQSLSRDTIVLKAMGYTYGGESNQVDVYIKRLRDKIEKEPGNPKLILTERRVGYRYQPTMANSNPSHTSFLEQGTGRSTEPPIKT